MYAESLRVQEKLFGTRTPEVAKTLQQFAALVRKMKNDDEAVAMEVRAKSILAEMSYTVKVGKGPQE